MLIYRPILDVHWLIVIRSLVSETEIFCFHTLKVQFFVLVKNNVIAFVSCLFQVDSVSKRDKLLDVLQLEQDTDLNCLLIEVSSSFRMNCLYHVFLITVLTSEPTQKLSSVDLNAYCIIR